MKGKVVPVDPDEQLNRGAACANDRAISGELDVPTTVLGTGY